MNRQDATLRTVQKKPMKPARSKPPEPPRGDSPHDIERIVPASGWFLGSSGSLFLEQWAADIYLQPYWDTIGWLYRVTTISVSWGISLAVVEIAFRAGPHLLHPTPWQISALGYLRIHVQDFGQIPVPNALRPDIPLIAALAPPPGPIAVYQLVGGPLIIGHSMPWHHTIELTKVVGKTDNDELLHYHKHVARIDHGPPPPILPRQDSKHYIFKKIIYTTQVQNCHRVVGPRMED